ncbi:peptidoglycan D,D-transpeptidase FtsI family protein [Minwuia sp.]|uniref:peptidoglycan D,D-transpeptidase FtsI family protein n=1 Tax=Minwuia sp. TaxID=2493630 RepID=UPI003A93A420
MSRTLFDPNPSAELTGRDLKRQMPTGDATRVRRRLGMLAFAFAIGFTALSVRTIQLSHPMDAIASISTATAAPAMVSATRQQPFWSKRAAITDRRGNLLAVDLPTRALMVHRRRVKDPVALAVRLADALGERTPDAIAERLAAGRSSVFLRRRLTPGQVAALYEVGDPALELLPTVTRNYPAGSLTAHIVGFLDVEHQGRAGIERGLQEKLIGGNTDAVQLSVDLGVQHVVRKELQASIDTFSAIGGAAIVLDVDNGEVVSLVSLPDFDANRREAVREDAFFNRATYGRYEMGSTFKAFTTAMALEIGDRRLTDGYDATHPIKFGRFTIRDHHAKARWMTVAEIFKYSSNIGAAKMAVDIGTEAQQRFLGSLGLLDRSPIELNEVVSPQPPARWRELETMTIAFGHGLAVSPMQLASAMAAMVNGGRYVTPTLLKRGPDNPATEREIMSEATSASLRKLLRLVVAEGTGRKAQAPGYVVGGKTGTAEKAIGRGKGYSRKRMITSFAAAFPMHAPRYVVLVVLDEPKGTKETFGYATAGWTAAPTIGRIIPAIAPILGIMPVATDDAMVAETLSLPANTQRRVSKNETL